MDQLFQTVQHFVFTTELPYHDMNWSYLYSDHLQIGDLVVLSIISLFCESVREFSFIYMPIYGMIIYADFCGLTGQAERGTMRNCKARQVTKLSGFMDSNVSVCNKWLGTWAPYMPKVSKWLDRHSGLNVGLKCLNLLKFCLLWMEIYLLIQKNNKQIVRSVIYQQIHRTFSMFDKECM